MIIFVDMVWQASHLFCDIHCRSTLCSHSTGYVSTLLKAIRNRLSTLTADHYGSSEIIFVRLNEPHRHRSYIANVSSLGSVQTESYEPIARHWRHEMVCVQQSCTDPGHGRDRTPRANVPHANVEDRSSSSIAFPMSPDFPADLLSFIGNTTKIKDISMPCKN